MFLPVRPPAFFGARRQAPRSPRIKGWDVASCFLPLPVPDVVENDIGEQRYQQHATRDNKTHVHSPYWNGVTVPAQPQPNPAGATLLPDPGVGTVTSDDDHAGASSVGSVAAAAWA
jgi:hypothetical protein